MNVGSDRGLNGKTAGITLPNDASLENKKGAHIPRVFKKGGVKVVKRGPQANDGRAVKERD